MILARGQLYEHSCQAEILGFLTLCVVRILDRNFVQNARTGTLGLCRGFRLSLREV